MERMTELEKLCNPVFLCICNYWQLASITNEIEKDKFQQDITALLDSAKQKAELDPVLAQEYAWIEKPLVFFIDYMVKEGRFPFREEWRELSRNYQELSGDEKFFNLLTETLEQPDLHNSSALFYIMLGLGFDGAYRYDRGYVSQCMLQCRQKADFDIYSEPVLDPPPKKHFFTRQRRFTVRNALIASAIFMVICFMINLISFISNTRRYQSVLDKTADDSRPTLEFQRDSQRKK
ncbi:MAG: DotU family type IV/VI secretion system protein [Spirochaetaceae bacterium]|jgi:type VI protein secretion system component VasF|nr:DotU family type IV/VI secretion system protein [Spirochaetaceae bacterium]